MSQKFMSVVCLFAILVFTACTVDDNGGSNGEAASTEQDERAENLLGATEGDGQEQEDYNWTIYVNDTSTISMGEMNMDISIDLMAVNTSGKIYGEYLGSATTKAVSYMDTAKGSINAPVEGETTSLVINVNPSVADDEKLASLTEPDPDDEKLAPLVPKDDDVLAPLTDGSDASDFEGAGSMTLVSGGTGTVTVKGVSVSRGIGNTSVNPLKVFITGTTVRLEVNIPEVGPVYFDGYIRGEGRE